MNIDAPHRPHWATAADGEAADTTPQELSTLGEHLHSCSGSRGRFFALRSAAETLHVFTVSRLITTLVVGVVLMAALVWLL